MLYTKDGDEKLTSLNLMGLDDNVIATQRKGEGSAAWYLYNKDVRESTSSVINSAGELAKAYEYDEFGETTVKAGESFWNEIGYTGQIYDDSTGLYYYNARFYDPEDGRFVSQDTYRGEQNEPGTWHLYTYCANNPVNFVDPSGHAFIRTYTQNQCRNTYRLLCAVEKTWNAIGWVLDTLTIVKARKAKKLKKAIKKVFGNNIISSVVSKFISHPKWLYGKFKKGFKSGGWGLIRVGYYTKKGKYKKRNEIVRKTKFVFYSIWDFRFYYSTNSIKNLRVY